MAQLTKLLGQVREGDGQARAALFEAAYPELHRLAQARLRGGGRNTMLDTGALVHESYLRLVNAAELRASDRRAFFAYASQVMRSVIVNAARERSAERRGGGLERLPLSTEVMGGVADDEDTILSVHVALEKLATVEPRLAQAAEMRYFGGYSEREIAAILEVSERTVQRDWEKARAILAAVLK